MRESTQPGRFRKWYVVGIDGYGSHHVANFEESIIYVVTASGQLEHVEKLYEQRATIEQWMGFVNDKRGWDDRRYGGSLLDGLVDGLEGSA